MICSFVPITSPLMLLKCRTTLNVFRILIRNVSNREIRRECHVSNLFLNIRLVQLCRGNIYFIHTSFVASTLLIRMKVDRTKSTSKTYCSSVRDWPNFILTEYKMKIVILLNLIKLVCMLKFSNIVLFKSANYVVWRDTQHTDCVVKQC